MSLATNKVKTLVLASASRYRAELLSRLKVPFQAVAPQVDESALPGENPADTASRLAEAKARAVASQFRNALVIGSDQVADLGGQPIGKPGNRERAVAQLHQASGRRIVFHTALALLNTESGRIRSCSVPTTVTLRTLSDAEIETYTELEPAFDCAGGARFEGLGISLIASLECSDPNALIGLPLIALIDMLREENFSVLA
jgi:septum formation protein